MYTIFDLNGIIKNFSHWKLKCKCCLLYGFSNEVDKSNDFVWCDLYTKVNSLFRRKSSIAKIFSPSNPSIAKMFSTSTATNPSFIKMGSAHLNTETPGFNNMFCVLRKRNRRLQHNIQQHKKRNQAIILELSRFDSPLCDKMQSEAAMNLKSFDMMTSILIQTAYTKSLMQLKWTFLWSRMKAVSSSPTMQLKWNFIWASLNILSKVPNFPKLKLNPIKTPRSAAIYNFNLMKTFFHVLVDNELYVYCVHDTVIDNSNTFDNCLKVMHPTKNLDILCFHCTISQTRDGGLEASEDTSTGVNINVGENISTRIDVSLKWENQCIYFTVDMPFVKVFHTLHCLKLFLMSHRPQHQHQLWMHVQTFTPNDLFAWFVPPLLSFLSFDCQELPFLSLTLTSQGLAQSVGLLSTELLSLCLPKFLLFGDNASSFVPNGIFLLFVDFFPTLVSSFFFDSLPSAYESGGDTPEMKMKMKMKFMKITEMTTFNTMKLFNTKKMPMLNNKLQGDGMQQFNANASNNRFNDNTRMLHKEIQGDGKKRFNVYTREGIFLGNIPYVPRLIQNSDCEYEQVKISSHYKFDEGYNYLQMKTKYFDLDKERVNQDKQECIDLQQQNEYHLVYDYCLLSCVHTDAIKFNSSKTACESACESDKEFYASCASLKFQSLSEYQRHIGLMEILTHVPPKFHPILVWVTEEVEVDSIIDSAREHLWYQHFLIGQHSMKNFHLHVAGVHHLLTMIASSRTDIEGLLRLKTAMDHYYGCLSGDEGSTVFIIFQVVENKRFFLGYDPPMKLCHILYEDAPMNSVNLGKIIIPDCFICSLASFSTKPL